MRYNNRSNGDIVVYEVHPSLHPGYNFNTERKKKPAHIQKGLSFFREHWVQFLKSLHKDSGQKLKSIHKGVKTGLHTCSNSVSVNPKTHSGQQKLTDESNRVGQLANLQGRSHSDYRNTKTFKTGSLFTQQDCQGPFNLTSYSSTNSRITALSTSQVAFHHLWRLQPLDIKCVVSHYVMISISPETIPFNIKIPKICLLL